MDYINREAAKDLKLESEKLLKTPRRNDATEEYVTPGFPRNPGDTDAVASKVIEAAFKVHRFFGPGLLESVYEKCLLNELKKLGCRVECQIPLDISYRGERIEAGYRIDMRVDQKVLVENKTVEKLEPIHTAQLLTYLRLTKCTLGIVINWNMPLLKDGLKRVVYRHPESRSGRAPRR